MDKGNFQYVNSLAFVNFSLKTFLISTYGNFKQKKCTVLLLQAYKVSLIMWGQNIILVLQNNISTFIWPSFSYYVWFIWLILSLWWLHISNSEQNFKHKLHTFLFHFINHVGELWTYLRCYQINGNNASKFIFPQHD